MGLALTVAMAVAYAVLAHLASATHDDRYAYAALLSLVAMMLAAGLVARRGWAWVALPLSLVACHLLYRAGLAQLPLLLVPVAFVAAIAWVFARSLWAPRGALISRIVAAMEGGTPATLAPDLLAYSRGLTAAWALALAVLGLANLALAMVASPGGLLAGLGLQPPLTITREQWSLFANILNYGIVGGFFLVEFAYRKRRFPGRYSSFAGFLRQMAGLGPAFWRDFLR
ncbi:MULTISPECIES: ketosynthase [unclassified Luteimonas]|uniref:ketosynthase n=1 Tax=unclassified Luteimonas TaxID=2629088 RepID=UPI0018F0E1A6|nr:MULTISPECIES: ketosynthase [unclassified Luteimonas]MBJ6979084.1 ketosynthase [Luteimonas sp. MC1895]MBJ6985100.1 ketosynthase [Luteimonas sp. MC1750]QQO05758.1 ketosynthase [Luteimonas sp. MC1750]